MDSGWKQLWYWFWFFKQLRRTEATSWLLRVRCMILFRFPRNSFEQLCSGSTEYLLEPPSSQPNLQLRTQLLRLQSTYASVCVLLNQPPRQFLGEPSVIYLTLYTPEVPRWRYSIFSNETRDDTCWNRLLLKLHIELLRDITNDIYILPRIQETLRISRNVLF